MVFKSMKFSVSQGASYARGTGIDPFLSEKEIDVLYKKWNPGWPEKNVFQGGVEEITCEMVLNVPEAELRKEFGAKMAAHLMDVAKHNAS